MVFKKYVFVLAALVTAGACRSTHDVSSNGKKGTGSSSSLCNLEVTKGNPVINWKEENASVLKGPDVVMLPAVSKIYSADSAELKAFFDAAKLSEAGSKAEIVLPLPSPVGCKVFSVFEAGTMAEELKKKFPDIVTLKGTDKESGLSDVRLEYNGRMMQAQVNWNGETYLFKPVTNNDRFYYIVYAKSATKEVKQGFEKQTETQRDQSKPVILKYDR